MKGRQEKDKAAWRGMVSSGMKESEILASFDGRGRAEFLLGGFEGMQSDKIAAIGHELGYDLRATEMPSRGTMRLIFVRDDSPTAR